MDMKLELMIIPVTDIDRAKAFYEQAGFDTDQDHQAGDVFRVVQVTPPGSSCSVAFGKGMPQPESPAVGLHLVVGDVVAARDDLVARGIEVDEVFHFGEEGQVTGPHPDRVDYGSFASFEDPDGNLWLLQEVASRA
jgi:catechol 2,3-dioxygenase-like lactoylglutathione lyase family enzyme